MKIGILQCGRSPEMLVSKFGDYDDMCISLLGEQFETAVYPVLDHDFPDTVQDADGWLITGSRFAVYEDHAWIPPLEDFLRAAYADSIPIVGICFGHQILAQALGGKVEKYSGGWSVGLVDYRIDGAADPLPINAFHQDQVLEPPADAKTIGSTDFCKHAILAYGNKALTLQPHPEFSNAFTESLIDTRGREVLPAPVVDNGLHSIRKPAAGEKMAEQIQRFFLNASGSNSNRRTDAVEGTAANGHPS